MPRPELEFDSSLSFGFAIVEAPYPRVLTGNTGAELERSSLGIGFQRYN